MGPTPRDTKFPSRKIIICQEIWEKRFLEEDVPSKEERKRGKNLPVVRNLWVIYKIGRIKGNLGSTFQDRSPEDKIHSQYHKKCTFACTNDLL